MVPVLSRGPSARSVRSISQEGLGLQHGGLNPACLPPRPGCPPPLCFLQKKWKGDSATASKGRAGSVRAHCSHLSGAHRGLPAPSAVCVWESLWGGVTSARGARGWAGSDGQRCPPRSKSQPNWGPTPVSCGAEWKDGTHRTSCCGKRGLRGRAGRVERG